MEWISGNIFVRPMGGEAGLEPGQKIDGVQLALPGGKPAWVLLDDFERHGPFHLLIEASCRHEFTFLGHQISYWMEKYLAKLSAADAQAVRAEYALSLGKAWCVYSHRTPQGDVSEASTGWDTAYR